MGVNGKAKGNSFERKIANLLSERFKEHTGLDQSFRRNLDSGSFFGGKNRFRTQTHDLSKASFGDMILPEKFKFGVECKFYKSPPSFNSLLKQDIKQWDGWLSQALDDCQSADQDMCLIIKYNGIDEIVLLDTGRFANILSKIDNGAGYDISLYYKNYSIITLKQFLSLPDSVFFDV